MDEKEPIVKGTLNYCQTSFPCHNNNKKEFLNKPQTSLIKLFCVLIKKEKKKESFNAKKSGYLGWTQIPKFTEVWTRQC